jgi:hypothetical protein
MALGDERRVLQCSDLLDWNVRMSSLLGVHESALSFALRRRQYLSCICRRHFRFVAIKHV